MLVGNVLRGLGNERAVDNARAATTDLARRRVEREAVEIFLEQLQSRSAPAPGPAAPAAAGG